MQQVNVHRPYGGRLHAFGVVHSPAGLSVLHTGKSGVDGFIGGGLAVRCEQRWDL